MKILSFIFCLFSVFVCHFIAEAQSKPRIIITADPELDDNNSLIRFLLYSTDLQIDGLIYASSQFHWKGDGKGTKWFVPGREYDRFGMDTCPCESWRWAPGERFIHDIVDAYAASYPNLKVHNKNYPSPEYLRSKIRYGNINFDGDFSEDTPGSQLIKEAILDDKPGKLFITAWGGASTIARALKSIEEQHSNKKDWPELKAKISRKVVLLPSGDQDDTFYGYIKAHWSDIEARTFRDSPAYGYGAQIRANEVNKALLTPQFMTENITSKGPLGKLYRVWGDGKQMVVGDKVDYFGLSGYSADELKKMGYFVWMPPQEKGSWLGEGDNATFMNMLGNGLRAYEDGKYGGWGGRTRMPSDRTIDFQTNTTAEQMAAQMGNQRADTKRDSVNFPDFFAEAQNSFAARMKWSVTPRYANANHEPEVGILGPLKQFVNPGQKVKISASVKDPDKDSCKTTWIQMPAGTYPGKLEISDSDQLTMSVTIPQDASPGQTFHFVIKATDDNVPALTQYKRVILEVRYR